MGRSGGGGGGRSSGGGFSGGSRSSGGFSGGSNHRSGGFSGGSSHRSGDSGYRPGGFGGSSSWGYRPSYRPHTTVVRNIVNNYGSGYGGGYYPNKATSIKSVIWSIVTIFIAFLIVCLATSMISKGDFGISKSTVEREPLPMSKSIETNYYHDEDGWFSNSGRLEKGLKHFYKKTGVQPYVYIASGSSEGSIEQLNALAVEEYDKLFKDEAHFILVFYDNGAGSYNCGYCVGTEAKTIMDKEAIGILADYLDRYYNDSSISDEEFFSNSFEKTADRIMTVQKSPLPKIFASIAIVVIVIIAFTWWTKAKEQKNKEAEQTERILNSDLNKFGSGVDPSLQDLEDKYS